MTSFPFLAIAREFGVPYGAIIRIAQCWSHGGEFTEADVDASLAANATRGHVLVRVGEAVDVEKRRRERVAKGFEE